MTFRPRTDLFLVKLVQPQAESKGGIQLAEVSQSNLTDGEVLACGPGVLIPELGERLPMSAAVGDRVLFPPHALYYTDEDEGVVCEADIFAVVTGEEEGFVEPAGEFVLLADWERVAETRGGLAVPERYQRREKAGRIVAAGPGRLRKSGALRYTRLSCCAIMGLPEAGSLVGRWVYWDKEASLIEVTLPNGEVRLLVAASDLCATEEG